MQTKLSVNLNKVALLRNQRDVGYPDVVETARLVIEAGAAGVTVHPRPDERHVKPADVRALRRLLSTEHGDRVELNVEGNPTDAFLALVDEVRPAQATLVPDSPEQRTSDHGWDFAREAERLAPLIRELASKDMRVSVFVDAEPASMARARDTGADRIELYTGPYAHAFARGDYEDVLETYRLTALRAREAGLGVNAGHDLTLENLPAFKRALPMIAEVSIGHAITADALKMGFPAAVRAYLAAIA